MNSASFIQSNCFRLTRNEGRLAIPIRRVFFCRCDKNIAIKIVCCVLNVNWFEICQSHSSHIRTLGFSLSTIFKLIFILFDYKIRYIFYTLYIFISYKCAPRFNYIYKLYRCLLVSVCVCVRGPKTRQNIYCGMRWIKKDFRFETESQSVDNFCICMYTFSIKSVAFVSMYFQVLITLKICGHCLCESLNRFFSLVFLFYTYKRITQTQKDDE